ncbi:MAG: DUF2461 domain-containing protein [Bacteroidota bacterium]
MASNTSIDFVSDFLTDLSQNNTREWMDEHKKRYQKAKSIFEDYVDELIVAIAAFDERVAGTRAKQSVFRLARDIRFSKDKTPYKTNFSAGISDQGRKSDKAFYYFQFQPEGAFIASGMYMVERDTLQKIRQEIDYNGAQFLEILDDPKVKEEFVGLQIFENQRLKTAPRGFDKEHEHIDLLRNKSFILSKELPESFFKKEDWVVRLADLYQITKPFNDWLNIVFD